MKLLIEFWWIGLNWIVCEGFECNRTGCSCIDEVDTDDADESKNSNGRIVIVYIENGTVKKC